MITSIAACTIARDYRCCRFVNARKNIKERKRKVSSCVTGDSLAIRRFSPSLELYPSSSVREETHLGFGRKSRNNIVGFDDFNGEAEHFHGSPSSSSERLKEMCLPP